MSALERARGLWRSTVPASIRDRVNAKRASRREAAWRRPRKLGELRRTTPLTTWGSSRGGPLDRVYIGQFVEQHAADVRGRVLEIAGDEYITRFGNGVTQADSSTCSTTIPKATIIADLVDADGVAGQHVRLPDRHPGLLLVKDLPAALRSCHRILTPGGVLLATTPGIYTPRADRVATLGQWWHLTSMSARSLAEDAFGVGNVDVQTYGNVLAAAGFLSASGNGTSAARSWPCTTPRSRSSSASVRSSALWPERRRDDHRLPRVVEVERAAPRPAAARRSAQDACRPAPPRASAEVCVRRPSTSCLWDRPGFPSRTRTSAWTGRR